MVLNMLKLTSKKKQQQKYDNNHKYHAVISCNNWQTILKFQTSLFYTVVFELKHGVIMQLAASIIMVIIYWIYVIKLATTIYITIKLIQVMMSIIVSVLCTNSSKKGSHVYFLLQLFCVVLLFDINVLLLPWWPDVTIVQSDVTIVVTWQLSTGSKHDYFFCYCPLVDILFEVLRITVDHWLF